MKTLINQINNIDSNVIRLSTSEHNALQSFLQLVRQEKENK